MRLIHKFWMVLLIGTQTLAVSANDLPDLGDPSSLVMTPAQEREIGEDGMRDLRHSGYLLDDPELSFYLNQMGQRLVKAAKISDFRYTFFVVQDKTVNAFAMPGGFVAVHTGLLVMAQNESELASVLSHEITHVSQHHLARMVDANRPATMVSIASLAAAILAARAGRVDAATAALAVGSGVNVQRILDYTYAFEQEADRIGMQTMLDSGFDPAAMPAFFERLQKYNRLEENNAPEFLRTHPVTYNRIADAQARLKTMPYRQVVDSPEFMLMREKARVAQMPAADAVAYYLAALKDKRYLNEAAHRYGLALAYFARQDYVHAQQALDEARKVYAYKDPQPIFDILAGRIQLVKGQTTDAIATFRKAKLQSPNNQPVLYGLIDALAAAKKYDEALHLMGDGLGVSIGDAELYQRAAKIYAAQGRLMEQYKAQGEYYAQLREYPAAIEQMEMALKQPGNDFYLLSGIEARLAELKQLAGPQPGQKRS